MIGRVERPGVVRRADRETVAGRIQRDRGAELLTTAERRDVDVVAAALLVGLEILEEEQI